MRYLTSLFLLLIAIAATCGMLWKWPGLVTWSLVVIFLLAAGYFTKFLKPKKEKKREK